MEKQQCEDLLSRSAADRVALDQNLRQLEADNTQLQRQLHALQTQLAHAEHDHTNRYIHTHMHTYARRYKQTYKHLSEL